MTHSIWTTIECHCWAAGLGYDDYLATHLQSDLKGRPLCKDAYEVILEAFDTELADDIKEIEL